VSGFSPTRHGPPEGGPYERTKPLWPRQRRVRFQPPRVDGV